MYIFIKKIFIHNIYTQHTHILCKQKRILDAINHLKALNKSFIKVLKLNAVAFVQNIMLI